MQRPKILIVDDDVKLLTLTKVILDKLGAFEILTEHCSFAVLQRARECLPDLVILDVDMPGKDGGEVAAELRNDPVIGKVPVIFLTSLVRGDEGSMRKGTWFLPKPVNPPVLLRTVRELLGKAA